MAKRAWLLLLCWFLIGLSSTAATADEELLIEAVLINGPKGYEFVVEPYGKARMVRVALDGKVTDRCNVSLKAVTQLLSKGLRDGSLLTASGQPPRSGATETVTIYLESSTRTLPDGRKIIECLVAGADCAVDVEVNVPDKSD